MGKAILLFFLILSSWQHAEQANITQHEIDQELDNCLAKTENMTTVGMVDCTEQAYTAWDQELNTVYNQLMEKLGEIEKTKLKDAQKSWLEFRDIEFENLNSIYNQMEGTMYIPMHVFDRVEIIRQRVETLESYLDLLEMEKA